jgi:hypothetical protein
MKLFIVGSQVGETWNALGIFAEETDAAMNCPNGCFIFPAQLNTMLPKSAVESEYIWWPNEQSKLDALARMQARR